MEHTEPFQLIDCFHSNEPVIDTWTFVTSEQNPLNGCNMMLATSETGSVFSQWTDGHYDPDGDNAHLGERPRYMPEVLLNHVMRRMESYE